MNDLTPAAHMAASRMRWLNELEAALDSCENLERALRQCGSDCKEGRRLRNESASAKQEIDRIRRARPRAKAIDSQAVLDGKLATWRGNQID